MKDFAVAFVAAVCLIGLVLWVAYIAVQMLR
jgi:hypothetical protein